MIGQQFSGSTKALVKTWVLLNFEVSTILKSTTNLQVANYYIIGN